MSSTSESTPQLTTALVAVGEAMIFKPTAEVIVEQVRQKEDMIGALEGKAEPGSLEVIHVVVGNKDLDKLFDEDAIAAYAPLLKEQGGEMTIHLLCGEGNEAGEDELMTVKMAFFNATLRLEQMVQGADGSYALTAYKGRRDDSDDEEEDEEEEDNGQEKEEKKKEDENNEKDE